MSAAVLRMSEAVALMRLDPEPVYAAIGVFLDRVANDAARRERHQTSAVHASYLATGERADARRIADAYLTTIREGATP